MRDRTGKFVKTHGHAHSKSTQPTPTYVSWMAMITRCYNINHKAYDSYGGAGIKMCQRWAQFANFLEDMGTRPPYKTLDRIDSSGHYEPNNCRWATYTEQARNQSNNVLSIKKAHQIRWLYEMGYLQKQIATMYGINQAQVSEVVNYKVWKYGQ